MTTKFGKQLLEEWSYDRNIIAPASLSNRSTEQIWWKCKQGHEWVTQFRCRYRRKSACPFCTGILAIEGKTDVATLYPNLSKEFHPTKNAGILLSQILPSSGKKVWWICCKGHEWVARVHTRTKKGYGCPVCSRRKIVPGINDLSTLFPSIASELHPEKNPLIDPTRIGPKSTTLAIWVCPRGHEYLAQIAKRTSRGDNCPYCSGHRPIIGETDLASKHPEALRYWNYDANESPSLYTAMSGKKVSWKCERGHIWRKSISGQINYNNCPFCTGQMLISGQNDIATIYPQLIKEWDSLKNPKSIHFTKANTNVKHWWICPKGHSYAANIGNKIKGKTCPYCSGKRPIPGENDLYTLFPELCDEWDYARNPLSPVDYLPKSNYRAWWKCANDHSWKTRISERTRGTNCPKCYQLSLRPPRDGSSDSPLL